MRLLIGLIAILVIVVVYFLPTVIAYKRKYKNRMSVLVVDLFLGWTLIGWVVALALSFINDIDENEKPSDKTVKTVAKIGIIILMMLCVLGAIGNTLRDIKISKYQSEYNNNTEYLNESNKDNSNTEQLSVKMDNPVDLLFQPNKLLELNEEKRKEILSNLSNEDIVLDDKDINAKDKDGKTVLMYASQYCNDSAIIETLIKNGASIVEKDDDEMNPLMYAIKYNSNPEITETLIINGANIDNKILQHASRYANNPDIIEVLLAKSTIKYDMDDALLYAVAANKNIDVIKTIIKHGGKFKRLNGGVNVIMLSAEFNKNPEVIGFLIGKGYDIKAKDNEGKTALMHACEYNNLEMITSIIEHGCDVNDKDKNGRTALMYACETHNSIEIIKTLIKHNANINATDRYGKNALMIAYETLSIDNDMLPMLKGLLDSKDSENITNMLSKARRDELIEILDIFINNKLDINAADNNGKTALMYACEFSINTDMISDLLEKGVNVNAKDKKGNTVYDYAKKNKNILYSKIKAVLDKYQNTNNEN